MLTQTLILPRMRATKNRQMFFMKKKKELQEAAIAQEEQRRQKEDSEIFPYYLKTLNKIKRSKRVFNRIEESTQPVLDIDKCILRGQQSVSSRPSVQIKFKPINFGYLREESRKRSLKSQRRIPQNLHIVISNGYSHDKTLPQKQYKRSNFARFRKLKQKSLATYRPIPPKTGKEYNHDRSRTIQDVGFQQMISKTKYLHPRTQIKHIQSNENVNIMNKIVQISPKKLNQYNFQIDQQDDSFRFTQTIGYQTLRSKYQSIMQGISSKGSRAKSKVQTSRSKKNASVFNTFDLTAW